MYKDQVSLLNIVVEEDEQMRTERHKAVSWSSSSRRLLDQHLQEYDIKEMVFNDPAGGMDEQGMYITMRFALPRYVVVSCLH